MDFWFGNGEGDLQDSCFVSWRQADSLSKVRSQKAKLKHVRGKGETDMKNEKVV